MRDKIPHLLNQVIQENPGVSKYPPRILCVDGDEYRIDLKRSVAMQDFNYVDYYDEKHFLKDFR